MRLRVTHSKKENAQIGEYFTGIFEDSKGNIWFSTLSKDVAKYFGKIFANYSVTDGLCDNMVSNILIDRKKNIWVDTWGGVCKFDGSSFINFPIPKPEIELLPYQTTMNWSTEIMEDSKESIWLGCAGGLFRLNSDSIINVTTNGPWNK